VKKEEDMTGVTFNPDISKKSKNLRRSVNDLYAWARSASDRARESAERKKL